MTLREADWVSEDGSVRLCCGDCFDILESLYSCADFLIDAVVVTDPPYGIEYESTLGNLGAVGYGKIENDDGELDIRRILSMNCVVIAFGANCYPHQLPHRGRWICWDKRTIDGACDAMLGSPMELAWVNRKTGYDQMIRVLHGGVVNADGGERVHPTQKPVRVMIEAMRPNVSVGAIVLDPFMGSGTTGVACIRTNRKFIGIEINRDYFEIAKRRCIEAFAESGLYTGAMA